LRRTWRVLDRAQDSKPDEHLLVEGVTGFSMRFLGQDNEWAERWPPQTASGDGTPADFPRAVEVNLELEDVGIINWLFRLPETFIAGAQPAPGSSAGSEEQEEDTEGGEEEAEDEEEAS